MSLIYWAPLTARRVTNIGTSKLVSVTATKTGLIGESFDLKGNGYIQTQSIKSSTTMTFACWFKLNSTTSCHIIDARWSDSGGYQPAYYNSTSGFQLRGYGSGSYIKPSSAIVANKWYHLCVTISGNRYTLYINGEKCGTVNGGTYTQGNMAATFGCRYNYTNKMNGSIQDARIYDEVLDDYQIKEIAKGLIIHLPLERNVADASGNENTTFPIDITYTSDIATKYAGATNFNGTTSAVQINYLKYDLISSDFTVMFWVYPTEDARGSILSDYNTGGIHPVYFSFERRAGNTLRLWLEGNDTDVNVSMPTNTWTRIVITHDAATRLVKVYRNGVQAASITKNYSGVHKESGIYLLGRDVRTTDSVPLKGLISDFRMYGTVLTAQDVLSDYQVRARMRAAGQFESAEFIESDALQVNKTYNVLSKENIEYYEYDGALWVPLLVHYVPNGLFSTGPDYRKSVYVKDRIWSNFQLINSETRPSSDYEFLTLQQSSVEGNYDMYRWSQTINPFEATWSDVNPSKVGTTVTRIYPTSGWSNGGMYFANWAAVIMCFSNSSSSNWYGCGIRQSLNGGIPGQNGKVVKGYQLLFMRVADTKSKFTSSKQINVKEIVER